MSRSLAMEILSAIAASTRGARFHENDGPDGERDFDVGEFERLDVSGPFDVEIRTGEAASVRATGPEWALEDLVVELRDDRLFIGCDGDCDGDVNVLVTVPRLRALRTSGSGDVSVDRLGS